MAKPEFPLSRMTSVADFAQHLGVSTKSVRRWIDSGALHVHRFGRQIRIAPDDAQAFIATRRR